VLPRAEQNQRAIPWQRQIQRVKGREGPAQPTTQRQEVDRPSAEPPSTSIHCAGADAEAPRSGNIVISNWHVYCPPPTVLQCIPKLSVAAGILPAAEGVHLAARSNA